MALGLPKIVNTARKKNEIEVELELETTEMKTLN